MEGPARGCAGMRRAAAAMALCLAALPAGAHFAHPGALAVFEQRLHAALPLRLAFRDAHGRAATLRDAFGKVPVVLVLGYLHCRDLCSLVVRGAVKSLDASGLAPGRDYRAVFVSIDPRDDAAALARALDERVPASDRGAWRFLNGDPAAVRALADAVGFHFRRDPDSGDYAHPAGFVIATPDGTVSRYFSGVRFAPNDVRLALVQAGAGRVGGITDQIALLCYHFDPSKGRYTLTVTRVLNALIGAFLAVCGALAWRYLRRRGRQGDA